MHVGIAGLSSLNREHENGIPVPPCALRGLFRGHVLRHGSSRTDAATAAGAARIILLHVSPRYKNEDLPLLEHEAMAFNGETVVGRDLDVYPIQFRD